MNASSIWQCWPMNSQAKLRRPGLARVEAERVVARDRELQVHADVHDHARRAEGLAVEHAELVSRVGQIAQVVHQPLGIERPALRRDR
jgi:hypothetical protein